MNIEFRNGKYDGDIKDVSTRHGKGTFIWNNGDKYEGQWKDDIMCGYGKYHFGALIVYEGEFDNNEFNGYGTLSMPGRTYIGMFKNNNFEGKGKYLFSDGSYYEGEFKTGEYDDQGTFQWAFGDKYIGQFKNGKMNGIGTYYSKLNYTLYGDFKDKIVNNGSLEIYDDDDGTHILTFSGTFDTNYPSYKGNVEYINTDYIISELQKDRLISTAFSKLALL